MKRQILHIDVNNAFLSWTAVDMLKKGYKIDIRNIPAVIAGDEATRRGIVLAKSNLAKAVGIKTGETLYSARKKCATLQVFKADYNLYSESSNKMYNLLKEYTEEIETKQISLFEVNNKSSHSKIDRAMDEIKRKYGYNSVTRASKINAKEIIKNEKENN